MDNELRDLVRRRASDRCEYCGIPQQFIPYPFQIEHIIARQHGGSSELTNLALACERCNAYKGPNLSAIDSETGNIVSLFNPRLDRWHSHFAAVGSRINGLTPAGRATVRLLRMNAAYRVELRQELGDAAAMPP